MEWINVIVCIAIDIVIIAHIENIRSKRIQNSILAGNANDIIAKNLVVFVWNLVNIGNNNVCKRPSHPICTAPVLINLRAFPIFTTELQLCCFCSLTDCSMWTLRNYKFILVMLIISHACDTNIHKILYIYLHIFHWNAHKQLFWIASHTQRKKDVRTYTKGILQNQQKY